MSTPATVIISESNGVGEVPTDGILNVNWGAIDAPNLVPADYPLIIPMPGVVYSYIKYHRFKVTAWVDTTTVDNLKVWKAAGSVPTGWSLQPNANILPDSGGPYVIPVRGPVPNDVSWPTTA